MTEIQTDPYPKEHLHCQINRNGSSYELKFGDKVFIRPCDRYFKEDQSFEGIFLGTIEFITPTMPVFYISALRKMYAGCESWWSINDEVSKKEIETHVEQIVQKLDHPTRKGFIRLFAWIQHKLQKRRD